MIIFLCVKIEFLNQSIFAINAKSTKEFRCRVWNINEDTSIYGEIHFIRFP